MVHSWYGYVLCVNSWVALLSEFPSSSFQTTLKCTSLSQTLIASSAKRFSSFMSINIIQWEALCQRGLPLASSSPVNFSVVKFCGKLDGSAKLDVSPPAMERSADQAHSRGKLCKSLPLIWWRTSWPQEYISRLGGQTAHTESRCLVGPLPFTPQLAQDPRLTSAGSSDPSLHDIPWPLGQICVEALEKRSSV